MYCIGRAELQGGNRNVRVRCGESYQIRQHLAPVSEVVRLVHDLSPAITELLAQLSESLAPSTTNQTYWRMKEEKDEVALS